MVADSMLESTEQSLLIIKNRTRHDLVVDVPHHAPAGVPNLPCPEHSDSDENTGFIGRHIAEQLDCCSVIACNSIIDPSKNLGSDYAIQIAAWGPNVLIEIHGLSVWTNKNIRNQDLELRNLTSFMNEKNFVSKLS